MDRIIKEVTKTSENEQNMEGNLRTRDSSEKWGLEIINLLCRTVFCTTLPIIVLNPLTEMHSQNVRNKKKMKEETWRLKMEDHEIFSTYKYTLIPRRQTFQSAVQSSQLGTLENMHLDVGKLSNKILCG
ncbi:hypothetical protein V1478_010938 [Vespula squamosa]|uniref:Uncharacterized protein n=1 Tax=Vespula squamosa TaxID=30214 RepID=A0ABD2AFS7_VESSQ